MEPMDVEIVEVEKPKDLHQESEKFSENITYERNSEQRLHPWFRTLPVRKIISEMHRTLSTVDTMRSFQILALGRLILKFLTKQLELTKEYDCAEDQDYEDYMKTLEVIFNRLGAYKSCESDGESIREFLDSVWELHTNGTIDLSKTSIPATIAQACPSRLENILETCLAPTTTSSITEITTPKTSELNINQLPSQLVPLCNQRPDNFFHVMQSLHVQYLLHVSQANYDGCQKVLDFSQKLQTLLCKISIENYSSLFPTPCQPLVMFCSCIAAVKDVNSQEEIKTEILNLLNITIHQCEVMSLQLSIIFFMLFTLSDVKIRSLLHDKNNIPFRRFPWLKLAFQKQEFQAYKSILK